MNFLSTQRVVFFFFVFDPYTIITQKFQNDRYELSYFLQLEMIQFNATSLSQNRIIEENSQNIQNGEL